MRRFQDLSLKQKFFRVVVFMRVVLILMIVGLFIGTDLIRFRGTMAEELSTLANIIGNNTTAALSFNDPKSAEETLSALRADPHIIAAHIYTKYSTLFASYFRQEEKESPPTLLNQSKEGYTFGSESLELWKPIILDRQRIGMIYVRSDLGKFYSRLKWYGIMLVLIIGISTILSVVFSSVLQKSVLNPISHLTQTMKKVSGEKDYALQVRRESNDEVGILVDGFNEMLAQIRKRDEALKEAEKKYRMIFENAITGIFQASPEGRLLSANPALAKIYGYASPEEFIHTVTDITQRFFVDSSRRKDYLQRMNGEGKISDFEFQSHREEGTFVWVSMNAQTVRGEDGEILFIEGSAQDITDRKRAEEEVKVKSEELARSNKELEQFAYVASHDLQEPLRMVTSYMQLLAKRYQGRLDRDANEFIEFAVDGATRMHRLINDLLAYSRVGTQGKAFAPTDSEVIFGEVLSNLQIAIEEKGARVTHEPLPTVIADDVQLGQVFQNLVANAIKFHDKEAPQVHVSAHPSDGEWVFSVKDNGIGIDPKFKERIFVIFQRIHGRSEYPGTGIGLAVCKKIVERHGGRIWVESEPGEGATFYFTIPTIPEERR